MHCTSIKIKLGIQVLILCKLYFNSRPFLVITLKIIRLNYILFDVNQTRCAELLTVGPFFVRSVFKTYSVTEIYSTVLQRFTFEQLFSGTKFQKP